MKKYIQCKKNAPDDWETPAWLFEKLNEEFHFDWDLAASDDNHLCDKYYTKEQDALKQIWGGCCYCNPPYGKVISEWVKKASESNATVVMLIPARTDTKWFHEYIYGKTEIRFIKGRLHYSEEKRSSPFPSMIVIFRGEKE